MSATVSDPHTSRKDQTQDSGAQVELDRLQQAIQEASKNEDFKRAEKLKKQRDKLQSSIAKASKAKGMADQKCRETIEKAVTVCRLERENATKAVEPETVVPETNNPTSTPGFNEEGLREIDTPTKTSTESGIKAPAKTKTQRVRNTTAIPTEELMSYNCRPIVEGQCCARKWGTGPAAGWGGQCTSKIPSGEDFCGKHKTTKISKRSSDGPNGSCLLCSKAQGCFVKHTYNWEHQGLYVPGQITLGPKWKCVEQTDCGQLVPAENIQPEAKEMVSQEEEPATQDEEDEDDDEATKLLEAAAAIKAKQEQEAAAAIKAKQEAKVLKAAEAIKANQEAEKRKRKPQRSGTLPPRLRC